MVQSIAVFVAMQTEDLLVIFVMINGKLSQADIIVLMVRVLFSFLIFFPFSLLHIKACHDDSLNPWDCVFHFQVLVPHLLSYYPDTVIKSRSSFII
jgi:hypothetical protein